MLKTIATLLLAAPLLAAACERYTVEVLPFEPRVDLDTAFRSLSEMAGGQPTFGMVRVTSSASLLGCTLTVGYRDPVVYVARELRVNSCAFEHVMHHEVEHVAIYRRALTTLVARLQARLAPTADLLRIIDEELSVVHDEHAAHDGPSYATNVTACGGRILRLTGLRSR